jgi:glucosamine 6-phosphate synthetase-like amidotransferase/phosphosugar isomerase protein
MLSLQKVKELTYMHSEGIMAGELKHGPLALVDKSMPVIMIVMRDPVYIVRTFICCVYLIGSQLSKL